MRNPYEESDKEWSFKVYRLLFMDDPKVKPYNGGDALWISRYDDGTYDTWYASPGLNCFVYESSWCEGVNYRFSRGEIGTQFLAFFGGCNLEFWHLAESFCRSQDPTAPTINVTLDAVLAHDPSTAVDKRSHIWIAEFNAAWKQIQEERAQQGAHP